MLNIFGWLSWVVTVIGLWFIYSPWFYGYTDQVGPMWNSIILGAVAAIISGITGYLLVVARPEVRTRAAS